MVILLARRITFCLHRIQAPVVRGADMGMIGVGDGIERVRQLVRRVAGSDVPVLIRGETGAGKEMVARALVAASKRADRPFVAVNMAAISLSTAVVSLDGPPSAGADLRATDPPRSSGDLREIVALAQKLLRRQRR